MNIRTSASVPSSPAAFSFGCFRLSPEGGLFRGAIPVDLPASELAALGVLVAHRGQIVTPAQLRKALRGDAQIASGSVSKCVDSLRAHLAPEECIETVYKRGYRLSCSVSAVPAPAPTRGAAAPAARKRLAILPFAAGFGVPEYLGAAAAEGAALRLRNAIPSLASVLAQDSVFALAARGRSALQIGRMLEADLVLTGSLRALPQSYRLRAEMFSVPDSAQLWVEDLLVSKDRTAGIESELAQRAAFRLHGHELSIAAAASEDDDGPQFREAYDLYRSAHYDWQSFQRLPMQDALRRLLRALDLEPSLTAARVNLVNLCVAQALYGYMPAAAAAETLRGAAESMVAAGFLGEGDGPSVDLDPRAESVLPALGWVALHVDRNVPVALRAFALSAHLPHDRWTTCARTMFLLSRHRFSEAIETLCAALRLDPYSPWLQAHLGWALHLAGDLSGSLRQIETAYAQFPEDANVSLHAALILAFHGEAPRAAQIAQELCHRNPGIDLGFAAHAYALACADRADQAHEILDRLEWLSRERFVLNSLTAAVHVALGEPEAALDQLRVANEARCPWFFQLLADPRLIALHGQPKFEELQAILRRMEATVQDHPGE
jgi:DNA-binding winged helix-turn-helix (wHTH) protein